MCVCVVCLLAAPKSHIQRSPLFCIICTYICSPHIYVRLRWPLARGVVLVFVCLCVLVSDHLFILLSNRSHFKRHQKRIYIYECLVDVAVFLECGYIVYRFGIRCPKMLAHTHTHILGRLLDCALWLLLLACCCCCRCAIWYFIGYTTKTHRRAVK